MKEAIERKPEWLELPDEQIKPKEVQTWTCFGTKPLTKKSAWWRRTPDLKDKNVWVHIYPSKEEAEAAACLPNPNWKWLGGPAVPETLEEALSMARTKGYLGVAVQAYRNGQWVTIRSFPVGVPYFGEDAP